MKQTRLKLIQDGGSPLILVSEAVELVRSIPWRAWAGYLAGTVPFLLACCFFVNDMARSADAEARLGGWCLLLLAGFALCKCSQVDLVDQMMCRLRLTEATPWTFKRAWDVVCLQVGVQSTGLILYPLSLALAIPAGWVNAFYQSFYVTGRGGELDRARPVSSAWKQSLRWPAQNHLALFVFGLLVTILFLNCLAFSLAIPWLGKTLMGWETTISRNYMTVFNTTLLMLEAGLTWLITDPVHKAIYALRCFRGDSIESGDDLRATAMAFRRSRVNNSSMAFLVVLCLITGSACVHGAAHETPDPARQESVIQPASHLESLNQAMDEVLSRQEYRWRIPGEERAAKKSNSVWDGLWSQVEGVMNWCGDMFKGMVNGLERWLRKWFSGAGSGGDGKMVFDWGSPIKIIAIALLVALAVLVTWWLIRNTAGSPARIDSEKVDGDQPPNLDSESVTAADLPVSGWWELGSRLLTEKEFRLAMRAFHLAALAGLADQRFISLARFKSNRDYLRELERRAHSFPAMVEEYRAGLGEFEQVWYGDHPASEECAIRYRDRMRMISASQVEGGIP